MKIKLVVLLLLSTNALNSQGIKFDNEKYESLPAYEPQKSQGYAAGNLPAKIS